MTARVRKRLRSLALIVLSLVLLSGIGHSATALDYFSPPNILMIIVDDLNDYSTAFDGYIGVAGSGHPQAVTPHIDRFLRDYRTTNFLSAQTPVPACKGARTAIMTGFSPGNTGVVSNYSPGIFERPEYRDYEFMNHYFRNRGYYTVRAGKVEHGTEEWDSEIFDRLLALGKSAPDAFDGAFTAWDKVVSGAGLDNELKRKARDLGVDVAPDPSLGLLAEFRWGPLDLEEEVWQDYKVTSAAVDFLESHARSNRDQPFFLAHGILKPHLPWYCPSTYFDKIVRNKNSIIVAPFFPWDLEDVGPIARRWATDPTDPGDFTTFIDRLGLSAKKRAVHAYLACSSFADAQVGRILKALDDTGFADNTIVVLVSDHGFMLGEKNSWGKLRLWEESLRVPFGIRVPREYLGNFPARPQYIFPVSTGSIFATLADLAFGEAIVSDYSSLKPLISAETTNTWVAENIASYYGDVNNVTLRRPVFRYTVYIDGFEELYDLRNDQGEHINVAKDPTYAEKRQESCDLLRTMRPTVRC